MASHRPIQRFQSQVSNSCVIIKVTSHGGQSPYENPADVWFLDSKKPQHDTAAVFFLVVETPITLW